MVRFTYEDARGTTHFKPWALPAVVAGICVPVTAAFGITSQGAAAGFAVAGLIGAVILVAAARSRPFGPMEVATAEEGGRRVLVLATVELSGPAAERIAQLAAGTVDVRVLIPAPSTRLDRWLSAEDKARDTAQDWLARSAGVLTAGGLPVSGSVGDADPLQAVADELRTFAADEVVVVSEEKDARKIETLRHRLALPVTRVPAG